MKFQSLMEQVFRKTKNADLMDLLMRQMNHFVDLHCLTKVADHWVMAKHLAMLLNLDVGLIAKPRINRLVLEDLLDGERQQNRGPKEQAALIKHVAIIYETTRLLPSSEVISSLGRLRQNALDSGGADDLRNAELIDSLMNKNVSR